MKTNDVLHIIDGKGNRYEAQIKDANHRKCTFQILKEHSVAKKPFRIHLAIAPTKSTDRLEWFVEKACELGVDEISIFTTQRTERKKVNLERLEKKAIGAMKQSKNTWKCQINEILSFSNFFKQKFSSTDRFIAYVETGKEHLLHQKLKPGSDTLIAIGPEGDFTAEEIKLATLHQFEAVSLGNHILRTETAGVMAVHTTNLINEMSSM